MGGNVPGSQGGKSLGAATIRQEEKARAELGEGSLRDAVVRM